MNLPARDLAFLDRLLDVVEQDILPLTEAGVASCNKLFGAALIDKSTLVTRLAASNEELRSPLLHGEMHLLERYHALPTAERPAPESLIFLSTHEPCSLCLSAITWSGFDNFFFLFSHEDSRDRFAIPHDIAILKEVFDVEPDRYRRRNAFWQAFSIPESVAALDAGSSNRLTSRIDYLTGRYGSLSTRYQAGKSANAIPLA